jgi:hypothetical protein
MVTGEKIRKLGFKRWYERQLIESHAYLVTCFLGIIVAATSFEAFTLRSALVQFMFRASLLGAGICVGLFAWRRYRDLMLLAERLGDGATCATCGTYASFNVLAFGPRAEHVSAASQFSAATQEAQTWLKVKCRKCGHEWKM